MQVQSARKSNCTGCLELPETDWKLRAELSGAPEGLTRLSSCARVCFMCACSCHITARSPLCPARSHAPIRAVCLHMNERRSNTRASKYAQVFAAVSVSSPRRLTTASNQPAGSLTVTVESSGPVSAITCALGPLEPSRCLGNNAAISSLLQACHWASRDVLVTKNQPDRNLNGNSHNGLVKKGDNKVGSGACR